MTPASGPRRVAWITGASSGIGRALALRLASRGWQVAASARDAAALATLAAAMPAQIRIWPLDVTDAAATTAAVAAITAALGPLDLCVFNAGTYRRDSAASFRAGDFRALLEVNLMGVVHSLDAVLPAMLARRHGQIAVVASLAGLVGLPGAAAYAASKAALIRMGEALQPELRAAGIELSIVAPGFVDTPLTRLNDFPMPFLLSLEAAVDRIERGLERRRPLIAFPWPMVVALKLLALLPATLRLRLTAGMVRS